MSKVIDDPAEARSELLRRRNLPAEPTAAGPGAGTGLDGLALSKAPYARPPGALFLQPREVEQVITLAEGIQKPVSVNGHKDLKTRRPNRLGSGSSLRARARCPCSSDGATPGSGR